MSAIPAFADMPGLVVLPERWEGTDDLKRAARACRAGATAADAIAAEGVVGSVTTDSEGLVRIYGEDGEAVEWKDSRSKRSFLLAEHWKPIPQGKDGAGDMLKMLQLRWPVGSGPEHFLPKNIADVGAIMRLGSDVCEEAARNNGDDAWLFEPFATVLRSAMRSDLVFNAPTPWNGAVVEVFIDVDETPAGYDREIIDLVVSRIPPVITPRVLRTGDDERVVVVPYELRMHDVEKPDPLETLRAMAAVEAMPRIREPHLTFGRRSRTADF